jgi:hypothetical protein
MKRGSTVLTSLGWKRGRLVTNGVRFAESVRTWLQATDYQQPDPGLSVGEAMDEARQLLTMARDGVFTNVQLEPGPRSIDVLHALCRSLDEANGNADTVGSAYDLVSRSEFLEDEFGERHQLLAHLAFLAWDRSRLEGDHPSMSLWQDRCRENVTAQETIRNFLALPVSNRSPELCGRFLADPAVMLAVCGNLSKGRNGRPSATAEESAFAYRWLTTCAGKIEDWSAHLAAEAAISAGASSRHLGRSSRRMSNIFAFALRTQGIGYLKCSSGYRTSWPKSSGWAPPTCCGILASLRPWR